MNLDDVLNELTVDVLKQRLNLLDEKKRPTRKADIIECIKTHLLGELIVRYWQRMDALEQKAVAESVYSWRGTFYGDAFNAKYGELPSSFTQGYKGKRNCLLFYYKGKIPSDLILPLKKLAQRPDEDNLAVTDEKSIVDSYSFQHCEHQDDGEDSELMQCRSMERVAQHDLHAVLRLVDSGKFSISAKTGMPGAASLKKIDQLLMGGDFYSEEQDECLNAYRGGPIRPIRAYAWPLLLQSGGLAKVDGNKLTLTRNGKKALNQPAEESLKLLYTRWRDKAVQDELRRINLIKGQTSKGQAKRNADERKECLEIALQECPVGQWVKVDELIRYMRSNDLFSFDICHKPWALYLCELQYGSLQNSIEVVRERYLLTCLFEYIATLGLIDVAYATPYFARRKNLSWLWGVDEIKFLSRYDGLCYIRLNALGSYVLDQVEHYEAPIIEAVPLFSMDQQLQIHLKRQPEPTEQQMLQQYSKEESAQNWQLDGKLLLNEGVSDSSLDDFERFLDSLNDGPLPDEAGKFFKEMRHRRATLRDCGSARLIHCADKRLASKLAKGATTHKLCLLADANTLVIPEKSLAAFRKEVEKFGFPL